MNDIEDKNDIDEPEELLELAEPEEGTAEEVTTGEDSAGEESGGLLETAEQLASRDREDHLCTCRRFLESSFSSPILKTMEHQRFPSILVSRNLEIVWENDAYRRVFGNEDRSLPVNLALDFAPDLDSDKSILLYHVLVDADNGFCHRERLQSIKRNRLTVVANAHFSPVFFPDDGNPCCYQVFFDIVTKEQKTLLQSTFLSLLEASKLKDNDTGQHISRVGEYSRRIAELLYEKNPHGEITLEFIENIHFLAPMHDVGKIGTPDDILNKNGPLDSREWEIMKEHTINGAYIMNTYPDIMAKQIALHHHERWDGSGYPYQIEGDMIPLAARIVSVADVYDALRMNRSYKDAFSHEKSLSIMRESRGTQFDPEILDTFLDIREEIGSIHASLRDSNNGSVDADANGGSV